MDDTENTPTEEVAPQEEGTQSEQVAETETSDETPATTKADTVKETPEEEEMIPASRYKELQSKFTKTAQEKAEMERLIESRSVNAAPQASNTPQLDPEAQAAVDARLDQRLNERRAAEFVRKHRDEIVNDPILAGTHKRLLEQAAARGENLDFEDAFTQAKEMLDERVKPKVKEAKQSGVEEGTELARKKGELGAVGVSGKQPPVDESKLSAKDFAKLHGLTHDE